MAESVLLTIAGAVAAKVAIESLRRMSFRLVGCGLTPKEWRVGAAEVDAYYQAPNVSEGETYLDFIKEVCLKENVSYVIPFIDTEIDLLSENREWFEEQGIKLCFSGPETIKILRNKKLLADFIADNCPEIRSIPTKFLRDIDRPEWDFPVVCKPYNGRSSQGLRYIFNKSEWGGISRRVDKDIYIVEPFISGPIVMVEIIRQPDTRKVVAMSRRELMSTSHGLSTTAYVFQDELLERNASILADKLDIRGNVNFEYILDPDGQYHFVECNPRFSAGCAFSCLGGYDIVKNHIRCFMGQEIEDYHFRHTMVVARQFEEVVTGVGVEVPYGDTVKM